MTRLSALRFFRRSAAARRLLAGPLAVIGLGIIAFASFAGFSGTSVASQPQVSTAPSVLAAGEYLYNTHCSSCHGVNGVGSSRAPELIDTGAAAANFYLTTGRMPLNYNRNQAQEHRAYFTPAEISEITSYVADLPAINGMPRDTGPGIPSILPLCKDDDNSTNTAVNVAGKGTCVTLSFGQQTFSLNCAECHQIAGAGGDLSGGNVIPSLDNPSEQQVVEAIRVGPKPMPVFGPGQLDSVQASAVAHYVTYLQHPEHPGGLRISGFGPVAEGFVGIVLGLGLLVFISRLMGTRG